MNGTFDDFGKRICGEPVMSHLGVMKKGPAYMRIPFVMPHLTAYSRFVSAEETGLKPQSPADTLKL